MGHHCRVRGDARALADHRELDANDSRAGPADRIRLAAAEARRARVACGGHGHTRPRCARRASAAPGARVVRVTASRRAPSPPRHRGPRRLARHSRAASAGRVARLAAQPLLPDPVAVVHVGHARGLGDGGVAPLTRTPPAPLVERGRRIRGLLLAVGLSIRAPGRSVPGDRRPLRVSASRRLRRTRARPSIDSGGAQRAQRRRLCQPDAAAGGQRLEHVRQEHAPADRGNQYRARPRRRARARRTRCGCRRSPSAPRCAFRTHCRRAGRGSMRRSRAFARSPTWRGDRRRCSSCSTSCFTAPTRTIVSSARPACCAACWTRAPSA